MTELINPSYKQPAQSFETAETIKLTSDVDSYVISSSSTTQSAQRETGIDESKLNAFDESHTSSSFDVTIDPGEALIAGALVITDEENTVTLDSDTNDQDIYVGWDADSKNTVLVGDDASGSIGDDFDTYDQKIHIWTFDTDTSGVTSSTDQRPTGTTSADDRDSTTATASGTGSQTVFTLSHSLSTAPSVAHVDPSSEDSSADFWVSDKTSSSVEITYAAAPGSGTDNLSYDLTVFE